ncbi:MULTISPECIES: NFACT RNA binding domain-containing protein [unclassified Enterococcus]|uniref:NFACT RNA binding domain-containing protein n=1 Tax=unclassified Enterococcus TaxID=2608891 RepID=UPI001553FCE4|nr:MULTISPECIES: NFACT RNA binding domain-containing protein [unclassified Enterococcus]MBS7576643.1 NFACT family protein [Enterococcus sp. MMGLQ5-2]MBS7583870.1 NFACT family protein [Enterococcus sp. MMGLQ5-1]NPD11731.1 fibronectin/fibrinogen-binding protein [Enterococcus sp. MMGLQ5-1]NPD36480.1 fibronectin/fibrinogen-binding protein [Enterococcus sp. MMGLQ5-2]
MAFDGVFLHAMTKELNHILIGGRVQKIHQPFDNELVLTIRNERQNHRLLLSAHPSFSRVQLTTEAFENPNQPTNFVMLLRKYLANAEIIAIEQFENDRILKFDFKQKDEIGDAISLQLIIEIMGKHSNIILINKKTCKIIEAIKHIGISQNSFRTLLPGASYIAPPSRNQYNPYTITEVKLFELLKTTDELSRLFFQQTFQGIGKETAEELVHLMASEEKIKKWHAFFNTSLEASYYETPDKVYFSPFSYQQLELLKDFKKTFKSLSLLLDYYYQEKARKDRTQQLAHQLIKKITNELEKNRKKLKILKFEIVETENAEDFRQKGELLTTYLHEIPKGSNQYKVFNYYTNDYLTIPLAIDKTPSQNAQKYFQKYQKLKASIKYLNEQMHLAKLDIEYLESIETLLANATPDQVAIIREELVSVGLIKEKGKRRKQEKAKPMKFISSDGDTILVGKNNIQNDELSFRKAKKTDIWLHAKDIPGSHVIIQAHNPSDTTITEAGVIAAYYSKFRQSNLVPVDVIEVRKLNKPTGAKPGFVTYRGQKTIFVTPDIKLIESLQIR